MDTSRDLMENIYVDNLLSGCDKDQAFKYYTDALQIMKEAGFNLRTRSVERIKQDNKLCPVDDINILGLRWRSSIDTMRCRALPEAATLSPIPTKREIISSACKLSIYLVSWRQFT